VGEDQEVERMKIEVTEITSLDDEHMLEQILSDLVGHFAIDKMEIGISRDRL